LKPTLLVGEPGSGVDAAPAKLASQAPAGVTAARGRPAASPAEKQKQTFRMPRVLVEFLRDEADRGARDLTGHVIRCLDGIRTYFGLPAAATSLLEADRKALAMDRVEYLLHALYHRSLQLREKGVGFDGPTSGDPRRR
jgi:hypothetical protein